jgi:small subunit ribosomal protein S6
MRHYEIVFIVHPDQSEQVPAMVERYKTLVESQQGTVHRIEDWGRLQLAHQIQKVAKAHYVLMNVECTPATLTEIETGFRFNDAVLRHLTVLMKKAETGQSPMLRRIQREEARKVTSEPAPYQAPASAAA